MTTPTLAPIATYTVTGTSTTSVVFNTFSSSYTDLRLVINGGSDFSAGFPYCYINSDTTNAYSGHAFIGNGSSAFKESNSNYGKCGNFSVAFTTSLSGQYIVDFKNYSNTNMNKTVLWKMNCPDNTSGYAGTGYAVTFWRGSKAAITSIDFRLTNSGTDRVWKAGTTFNLYGIAAEGPSPKATGGTIYTDAEYYYHVFGATGTFTPLQSLTADVLVIAGGGGGGCNMGGGGGAGGVTYYSSQSLTATGYTCTVGSGGAFGNSNSTRGSSGGNSQFASLSASVGGGGGGSLQNSYQGGLSGGSGGGGAGGYDLGTGGSGGAATSGQGYAGGAGASGSNGQNLAGGGGGGAGATGGNGTGYGVTTVGGTGGIGTSTYSSWGLATGVGEFIAGNYYIAGGGGGGIHSTSTSIGIGGYGGGGNCGLYSPWSRAAENGIPTSGGGGGGGTNGVDGANGGSGVVIVRYLK